MLNILMQFFSKLLTLLQLLNLLSISINLLRMLFQSIVLLPIQLSVCLYSYCLLLKFCLQCLQLVIQQVLFLLTQLQIMLDSGTHFPHIYINGIYHFLHISPQMIDIIILQFYFLRDALSEGCDVVQHLTTFLHPYIQYFKLLIDVLTALGDLPRQLNDVLRLLLELLLHRMKDASFKDLGIIRYHQGHLTQFIRILCLVYLQFVDGVGGLQNTLLHRTKDLLNYLTHPRLHLKPLKLLHFELQVLSHCNKIIIYIIYPISHMTQFKKEIHSTKWGRHLNAPFNAFPMNLADMDMPLPQVFKQRFITAFNRINNLTYKTLTKQFYSSIINWYSRYHHIDIKEQFIIQSPSVNSLFFFVLYTQTNINDNILITSPVYMKFNEIATKMGRNVIDAPLNRISIDKTLFTYQINLDIFFKKCKQNKIKLLIICNPHNPGGKVWQFSILKTIVQFCKQQDILIFSDQICIDLSLIPIRSILHVEQCGRIIVSNSLSKAFNVSSLKGGYGIVRDGATRTSLKRGIVQSANVHLSEPTTLFFSIFYSPQGHLWLKGVKQSIIVNYTALVEALRHTNVMVEQLEGSYSVLMDFGNYGKQIEEIEKRRKIPSTKKMLEQLMEEKGIFLRHHQLEYVGNKVNYQVRACISVDQKYFKEFIKRILIVVQLLQGGNAKL